MGKRMDKMETDLLAKVERTKKALGKTDYSFVKGLLKDWSLAEEKKILANQEAEVAKASLLKGLGKNEILFVEYLNLVWMITSQQTETPVLVDNKKILKAVGLEDFLGISKVGIADLRNLVGEDKLEKFVSGVKKSVPWVQILAFGKDGLSVRKEKAFGI